VGEKGRVPEPVNKNFVDNRKLQCESWVQCVHGSNFILSGLKVFLRIALLTATIRLLDPR